MVFISIGYGTVKLNTQTSESDFPKNFRIRRLLSSSEVTNAGKIMNYFYLAQQ